ncbi:hypothetical protein BC829DRAFT_405148, partial [Chytridium lagenaria]
MHRPKRGYFLPQVRFSRWPERSDFLPKIETPKAQSRNFSSRLPQARKEERKPILTPLQTKSQISSLERP